MDPKQFVTGTTEAAQVLGVKCVVIAIDADGDAHVSSTFSKELSCSVLEEVAKVTRAQTAQAAEAQEAGA